MATLRGEPVDRPPVSFYEIGGFNVDPADPSPFNVYNDPSWQPLLQLAEEHTDLIRMRGPSVAVASDNCMSEFLTSEQYVEGGRLFTRTRLEVGGRTLTSLSRQDPDVHTVWTIEHLLKDVDDLRAYLELPAEVFSQEIDVSRLIEEDEAIGDRGIVMVETPDPICLAAGLFSMEDYTVIALTEQKLFHELLEKLSHHLYKSAEKVASGFPGHLWRIAGPEYATPPYLPPSLFREYVVLYTEPIVRTIAKHDGFPRIHCHGRIKEALPCFIEMGAVGTDPIEPPPQGNVELADVRREYGRDLVLFGNLEVSDIEMMEPPEFEKVVARSLRDGASGEGRGFVLMPSSAPYGRVITEKTLANYETMVRLATAFQMGDSA